MRKILSIIQKKSSIEALVALVYFLIVGFMKWRINPSIPTLLFFTGGVLGMYLLDIAEAFFHLSPSPFRSIVFTSGFILVSLFVITSTASMLGAGLVLSLFLTLIMWQINEWRTQGNLNRWYIMISGSLSYDMQRLVLAGFIIVFFAETFIFLR